MLLRTDASVEVGEQLDVLLPLSLGNRISTTDRVIRVAAQSDCEPGGDAGSHPVEVALQFTRITSVDREWIVRHALVAKHRRRQGIRGRVTAPRGLAGTEMGGDLVQ